MNKTTTPQHDALRLTRITNACVLIELGDIAILTDPWFRKPWGFTEEPGLRVDQLPKLCAIIGSHSVSDHWDMPAFANYPYRDSTAIYTATRSMAKRAQKVGFGSVKTLDWGDSKEIAPGLFLDVIAAQRAFGLRSNNYVLTYGQTRLFFGGETRRLEPLADYRARHPAVDVALVPVNGIRLLGFRLVTTAEESLTAAEILGAHTLIPIHDSMHAMGLGGPTSSRHDLKGRTGGNPQVLFLEPGETQVIAQPRGAQS